MSSIRDINEKHIFVDSSIKRVCSSTLRMGGERHERFTDDVLCGSLLSWACRDNGRSTVNAY